MTANEKLKGLIDELANARMEAVRIRTKIVQVSNATDWLGTKYEREWLFQAETGITEAIQTLARIENAIENVRASWVKKDGKK